MKPHFYGSITVIPSFRWHYGARSERSSGNSWYYRFQTGVKERRAVREEIGAFIDTNGLLPLGCINHWASRTKSILGMTDSEFSKLVLFAPSSPMTHDEKQLSSSWKAILRERDASGVDRVCRREDIPRSWCGLLTMPMLGSWLNTPNSVKQVTLTRWRSDCRSLGLRNQEAQKAKDLFLVATEPGEDEAGPSSHPPS